MTNQDQYTTFGKFDMGIEGNIQEDKSKFLALYEDPNIFSGKEKSIYMTNTRFLNRLFLDSSKMVDEKQDHDEIKKILLREEEGFNSAESMAGKMIVQLKDSNVSEKLKQSILRLILRVFQSNISVYTNRHSQMFLELLGGLMKLLKKWGEGSEYQVSIAEIVTALNILLDNRISANTRDFEIPQNSLRFSGSSSKLLVAYSNVVSDLTSIIKKYKESIEQPLKYLVFVTADIDSKISSKLFFPRDNDFRFLNVKIPIDMMYNVQYTIPWLIHEIGHFLRGYKREERNRSYFKCVFSAFHIIAKPYLNKSFLDGSVDLGHKKVCNAKCCDVFEECNKQECRFERFDDYAILIQRFWIMYILESGCQRNSVYNIPDKRKGKYIQDMHEISVGIKDAYEEGIADVFMIRVLQIDDCVHYLKIMIEYFDNNRINIDTNLSTNIVIRIIAILIYISKAYKEHQKGYRIFEEHIEGIRTQNVSVKMNNLCDTILSKGQFYSVAEILSEFLASKIEKGMDELFKRDDVIKLQERIFQSYSDIVTFPDEFKNYISFITEFQK